MLERTNMGPPGRNPLEVALTMEVRFAMPSYWRRISVRWMTRSRQTIGAPLS